MAPTDYDELAPGYDQRYRDRSYPGVRATLIELFGGASAPVVEVGCGTAQWVAALAAAATRVLGLDASAAMLSAGRVRATGRLARATAARLPLRTASCAGIYCVHALHHFPDKPAFLAEVARVLAPGGRFAVISLDPARGEDRWVVYDYWPETRAHDLARYLSHEQLQALCAASGLTLQRYGVAEQLAETRRAEELVTRGEALKRSTSQLADLSDEAWQRGLARLTHAARENAALEVPAFLRLSLWVFEKRTPRLSDTWVYG